MKILKLLAVFVALFIWAGTQTIRAQEISAVEIIKNADLKMRGETSQGTMIMTITRPSWERTVEMKTWSKGDDYSMIYITAPSKEKGQVFLKRGKEMWSWVPKIQRMIKVPPSMMMQSWMGSDFTNDDLVKQSSIVKDYTHAILGKEIIREQECYKVKLIAKEDAPVSWGKIISWVTVDGFNTWRNEYYDEEDYLINTENAYDIKKMGDRTLPAKYEIIPEEDPGNKTTLIFKDMIFNKPIKASFFSIQNMKRIK